MRAAVKQNVLVHFVVPRLSTFFYFDLFVSPEPMPKQPQIPTGKIAAVIDPPAEEPEAAIQIKPVYVAAANRVADLAFQFRCNSFVGVDNQQPFMLPRDIFQRPVLLPWDVSIPNELHDSSSCSFRDCLCAIGARGIDYHDLVCK